MVVTVPAPAAAIIFAPIESWWFPSSYAHQLEHINSLKGEATVYMHRREDDDNSFEMEKRKAAYRCITDIK